MYADYKEFNRYLFDSTSSSYTAELPNSIFNDDFYVATVGTTLVIKLFPTSGNVTFYPPSGYALYDSNGNDYGNLTLAKGDTVEILMYRINMNAVIYQVLNRWA